MTIRLTNEIAFTQENICSACFNQEAGIRHVDFDAASDRGYGDDAAVKITLDNLIICERCLRVAANKIGFADDGNLKEELALEKERNAELDRRLRKQKQYAEKLEAAFESRPNKIEPDYRKRQEIPA